MMSNNLSYLNPLMHNLFPFIFLKILLNKTQMLWEGVKKKTCVVKENKSVA